MNTIKLKNMETKACSRCKQEKKLSEFSKDKRYAKGVIGQCRTCASELKRKRYCENPGKYRKKMNDWIARTPELTEKRRIRAYAKYLKERGFKIESN